VIGDRLTSRSKGDDGGHGQPPTVTINTPTLNLTPSHSDGFNFSATDVSEGGLTFAIEQLTPNGGVTALLNNQPYVYGTPLTQAEVQSLPRAGRCPSIRAFS
jgi:hypothetical protein